MRPPRNRFRSKRSRLCAPRATPLRGEPLEERALLALAPQIVADINTLPGGVEVHNPIVNVNGVAFFPGRADDGDYQLWKSDGTAAGTTLVKDVTVASIAQNTGYLVNAGGTLYFPGNDGVNGYELWKSDGTTAGTVLVKDIWTGVNGSFPKNFTAVNGTVYFTASDSTSGNELWKTDGTAAGTVRVKDIRAGTSSSSPRYLVNVNGVLFFSATDGVQGRELWKSDGTPAGTVIVKDILAGAADSTPTGLTNVNGKLFFAANDGTTGAELWISDGTGAGTAIVTDIHAGASGANIKDPVAVNSTLFFSADDGQHGATLWKSDGTAAGTVMLNTVPLGFFSQLANVNGTLFFSTQSYQLWKSDGTAGGTVFLSGSVSALPSFTDANGTLFFRNRDTPHGYELWKSDGTAAGTVMVSDLIQGTTGSLPRYLVNVSGRVFFQASDPMGSKLLASSDGTAAGTAFVVRSGSSTASSSPAMPVVVGQTAYFAASDGVHGSELWKTDGTAAGTALVMDILPGPSGSSPHYLTNVNGTLFFSANDGTTSGLWKTDGTPSGTVLVDEIHVFTGGRRLFEPSSTLINVSGTLFFTATDSNGLELWKSNGTAGGTVLVKDIRSGASSSGATDLTNVNGTLFFRATDGVTGVELWKSDGTAAGTVLVKDIRPGAATDPYPQYLTNVGGTLFFSANDGTSGNELWKSDGTAAGTTLVKDTFPGSSDGKPRYFADVNGTLFFQANDGTTGTELWKSDGTSAGTVVVKDMAGHGLYPRYLTNVNGTLFFDGFGTGHDLWKSDGTATGTTQVKAINSTRGSYPEVFTNANGTLFFTANDGSTGRELWMSDGTSVGTLELADIAPGAASSSQQLLPQNTFALFSSQLLFAANDIAHGRELWSVSVPLPPLVNAGTAADVVYNLPATANTVFLEDDGTAGNGMLQLRSGNGTFGATVFANPTGSLTIHTGAAADTITLNSLPDFHASLTIGSAAGSFASLTFGDALALAADKNLTAFASGKISIPNATSAISTAGSGSINLTTSRNIVVSTGASLATVNGDLNLSANQQATSSGNFAGIIMSGTLTTSGSGNIQLAGIGGNDAATSLHIGIDVLNGLIQSTAIGPGAGKITLTGQGGAGTTGNDGVTVEGAAEDVESVSGDIEITGIGGNGSTSQNRGVSVINTGQIKSTGTGASAANITLTGIGGTGTSNVHGISVGTNSLVTTVDGNISFTGQGGTLATGSTNHGININAGIVRSASTHSGAGTITLIGQGGGGSTDNYGVVVQSPNGDVESVSGDIHITGTGGSGPTTFSQGIVVINGGQVKSTGTGAAAANIILTGTGGGGTSSSRGIEVYGTNSTVTAIDGDISLTGSGGALATGSFDYGVFIGSGGSVSSSGTGASAGNITIDGHGGGAGEAGSAQNQGVRIDGAATEVNSIDGNVSIMGTAGTATTTTTTFAGVRLVNGGSIIMTGAGSLGVNGTASAPTGMIGSAVALAGTISVAGPSVTLLGDTILLDAVSTPISGANAVIIRAKTANREILLGTDDTQTQMGLTDAELDRISAGSLQIGDASSGPVTITAGITRPAAGDVSIISGADINFAGGSFDTAGGDLLLSPAHAASARFTTAGVDADVGAGTLSLASGSNLAIAINGKTVDTQYDQANVAGKIDLTGVNLLLSGSYVPVVGDAFVIVNNGSGEAVLGAFNGLPDGTIFDAPLGSFPARLEINYRGGDGNDVVLSAINVVPTFAEGADQNTSDESGPQIVSAWATGISPGAQGDAGQTVHFVVQANTNPTLFAVQPAVDSAGNLSFTPAPNASGSAQITVAAADNGGTANGGIDTSDPQTFAIDVAKAHPWHNAATALDVNADGHIAPIDALIVINFINAFGSQSVPDGAGPDPPYLDVNADGAVAPIDALNIINRINAVGSSEGEAGANNEAAAANPGQLSADLLLMLAADAAFQPKRRGN